MSRTLWNQPISGGNNYGGSTQYQNDPYYAQRGSPAAPMYNSRDFAPQAAPMPTTRLEDTDLYNRALSVSSPRLAPDETADVDMPTIRKKVVRRVEVPFTRKVKVPTTTTQIVPTMTETKVPTKKLIQVPSFDVVDEQYTAYEDREMIRDKEVWVKQIIPEKFVQKVPIQKTRQVKKPTTVIKEVDDWEIVQVPSHKAVEVQGYRIDEVEDSKLVEVEEYQNYQLRPHPDGPPVLAQTKELGRIPNSTLARSKGSDVLHPDHPDVRGLDEDALGSAPRGGFTLPPIAPGPRPLLSRGLGGGAAPPGAPPRGFGAPPSNGYGEPYGAYDTSGYTDPTGVRPAGAYKKEIGGGPRDFDPNVIPLGLKVKNTFTRHTDGTGVLVTNVDRGSAAAHAGLQMNDIITSVQGQPTTTVDEFAAAVKQAPGQVSLTLNRDGRRNIGLTLYR